jgi:hypothetical protein
MRRIAATLALATMVGRADAEPPAPAPAPAPSAGGATEASPPPAPAVAARPRGAFVVDAIAAEASAVAALSKDARPTGDVLADRYVRAAAKAAGDDLRAFATALAWAVDDGDALEASPFASAFRGLETAEARRARRATMGVPTLRGRADLLKHFAISAALSLLLGPDGAAGVGVAKELSDARGGTGFSFADLLADRAGIEWMRRLRTLEAAAALRDVAASFSGAEWMPDPAGQPEGLSMASFEREYGGVGDPRFAKKREELAASVAAWVAKRVVPVPPR